MFYIYLPTSPPCMFYIYLSTCLSCLLFSLLYRTLLLVFWKISAFVFWMRVSKEPEDFNMGLFPNDIVASKWISPAERYAVVPDETLGSIVPQLHQVTHVDITQLSIYFLLPQNSQQYIAFFSIFCFYFFEKFFLVNNPLQCFVTSFSRMCYLPTTAWGFSPASLVRHQTLANK